MELINYYKSVKPTLTKEAKILAIQCLIKKYGDFGIDSFESSIRPMIFSLGKMTINATYFSQSLVFAVAERYGYEEIAEDSVTWAEIPELCIDEIYDLTIEWAEFNINQREETMVDFALARFACQKMADENNELYLDERIPIGDNLFIVAIPLRDLCSYVVVAQDDCSWETDIEIDNLSDKVINLITDSLKRMAQKTRHEKNIVLLSGEEYTKTEISAVGDYLELYAVCEQLLPEHCFRYFDKWVYRTKEGKCRACYVDNPDNSWDI